MIRFALRKPMTAGLAVLAGLTLFRVVYIQIIPLAADEAYYWQWSRHLAWGYFDNGPLVGWVIKAGTLAFGETALGIRIPAVIFSLGIGLLVLDFSRRFLKDPVLGMALTVLYNVAPIFAVGSVIMTYDTVQAFFWLLAVYLAAMAVFENRSGAWYGAGLAAGFSMLAKYSSGLLPLLIFAFLALERRDPLSRKEPWLAALLALLVLAPNMIWVADHGFAPFRYNLGRTGGEWIFSLPDFVGGQVGMTGPILFGLLIYGSRIALREARAGNRMHALLLATSWPVLLLFALLSIKTRVYGTWAGPAYLTMGLAAGLALRRTRPAPTAVHSWTWAGLIMGAVMVAIVFAHPLIIRAVNLPAPPGPHPGTVRLGGSGPGDRRGFGRTGRCPRGVRPAVPDRQPGRVPHAGPARCAMPLSSGGTAQCVRLLA